MMRRLSGNSILCGLRFFVLLGLLCASIPGVAEEKVIGPGIKYTSYKVEGPNSINVVQMDRTFSGYGFKLGLPSGRRNFPEKETLDLIVSGEEQRGTRVLAAVNGSFFGEGNQINGYLASDGSLIQTDDSRKSVFVWTRTGKCSALNPSGALPGKLIFPNGDQVSIDSLNRIRPNNSVAVYTLHWGPTTTTTAEGVEVIVGKVGYPLRLSKDVSGIVEEVKVGPASINNLIPKDGIVISARDEAAESLVGKVKPGDRVVMRRPANSPEMKDMDLIISGAGRLLRNGKPFREDWAVYKDEFINTRHPRTAVAWNEEFIWLFTCDGRQPGYSVGMTFEETAEFLKSVLGASDAVNLDGGGSTTMTLGAEIVNHPSDGYESSGVGTPRKIADALMLIEEKKELEAPLVDEFPKAGRNLPWDDKYTHNGVVPFSPLPPGGDGYVLDLRDPSGGYDTVSLGSRSDADYAVEAYIYCRYRPDLKGSESYGIFARDDGGGSFLSARHPTGNCYALFYESETGRIRTVSISNGKLLDLRSQRSPTFPSTAWRKLRIECEGATIRFLVDNNLIAEATDTGHRSGPCGIGFHEYFSSNKLMTATYADSFKVIPLGEHD